MCLGQAFVCGLEVGTKKTKKTADCTAVVTQLTQRLCPPTTLRGQLAPATLQTFFELLFFFKGHLLFANLAGKIPKKCLTHVRTYLSDPPSKNGVCGSFIFEPKRLGKKIKKRRKQAVVLKVRWRHWS